MALTMRRYTGDDDYWRIRAFLREVFLLNGRRNRSWEVARLDYWRWHVSANIFHFDFEDVVFIWEDDAGLMQAVLNPENPGEAYLQVHPSVRSAELEREMITVAEEQLRVERDGSYKLRVWAHADDDLRNDVLTHLGYEKEDWSEQQRRRSFDEPLPAVTIPAGYTVRAVGGFDELPARSWVSWRAFHPDEPDENYDGWAWYENVQNAPLYRRQLDIVTEAPDGELASFCTLWYDDVTRSGYFEPVGTDPDHQRRGLGKAMMIEAMRRLKEMGGTLATVAGTNPAANALYSSVMGPDYALYQPWMRSRPVV